MKISFIVNPHSGGGKTGRDWPKIKDLAKRRLGQFDCHFTAGAQDATKIARRELENGAELIVCVGGDGTLNEVLNGFIENDRLVSEGARLGFLPNGTGCDFVRTAAIPTAADESIDLLLSPPARRIDVGKMTFQGQEGKETVRYFHNIASFGLGGEVDARVNASSKLLGPFISFFRATVLSILLYGKKKVLLKVDDHFCKEVPIWNVAVANGQYHGGGMWVAPEASLKDGLFQVVVIGDLSLPQVFWQLPKLYNGKINTIAQVKTITGRKITASSEALVLLDMDGEQPGRLPASFEILPGLLPLITG